MNLVTLLSRHAEARPDEIALIEGVDSSRRTCTYGELEQQSARGAALLLDEGLTSDDVVLVAQPVSIQLYVLIASVLRAGLVAMIPDPTADRDHLRGCCLRRPPAAFVGPAKAHLLRLLIPEVREIPHKFVCGRWPLPGATDWQEADGRSSADITDRTDDDPALLTFTSGSTGHPKAAVRSHGLLRSQYQALRDTLHLESSATVLSTLPIFVLAHLAAGMTSVLCSGDPLSRGSTLQKQLSAEELDRFEGPPAVLQRLMDLDAPLSQINHIATGGAPVYSSLLHELHERAPDTELLIIYGSTEAEPIASQRYQSISTEDWEQIQGQGGLLVGSPSEAITLKIIKDRWGSLIARMSATEFAQIEVPPSTTGEIVVTGPHVLKGYLDGMGDAETKFRVDGRVWHRTGDAGCLDDDGRIWLMGRCSTRIDDRKGRLYTLPVMSAAQTFAGVKGAAVISKNGRRMLVVEQKPAEEVDQPALLRHLSWAQIDDVKLVEELPKDRRHRSKIDYPKLQKMM